MFVNRCARACDALRLPHAGAPIVVACSGGCDSAAALDLLRRVRPQARLWSCYVDHRMRPRDAVARDVAAVRAQAGAAGAMVEVRALTLPLAHGSREAAMREARYRLLAEFATEVGAGVVVTGHQRADRVESMLLAMFRGSGLRGLTAMRGRRPLAPTVDLVRPLLWATKTDLASYVGRHGLLVSRDDSNDDMSFRRNAVRRLMAGVERLAPGAGRAAARCATLLREDEALLDHMTKAAWRASRVETGSAELRTAALRRLPPALLRRVVRLAVRACGGDQRDFHFVHCAAIARAIKEGRGGLYHAGGLTRVRLSAGRFVVRTNAQIEAGPSSLASFGVPRRRCIVNGDWGKLSLSLSSKKSSSGRPAEWSPQAGTLALDAGLLQPGTKMELRYPKLGDTCVPSGRKRRVSLARFLSKAGVPKDMRRRMPLLTVGAEIVAVLGKRTMEPYGHRPGNPQLEIRWRFGR